MGRSRKADGAPMVIAFLKLEAGGRVLLEENIATKIILD
jgi:hypothetical protein